ncbi:MAG: arylsulfatase, partial [Planctomycetota bacterium]
MVGDLHRVSGRRAIVDAVLPCGQRYRRVSATLVAVLAGIGLVFSTAARLQAAETPSKLPNIVVILADDMGYGDLSCYNPDSKVPTPHVDKLAAEGIRFTDAHSPATVCTPSRYSILTGRMCYRIGVRGVLVGVDGPLITDDVLTLPQVLKARGYRTAAVGKWHVGMTFYKEDGTPVAPRGGGVEKVRQVDFSRAITDGPTDRGFDYFFGTACCPTTDWLYAYIENDHVVQAPTEQVHSDAKDWLEYDAFRSGLKSRDFEFDQVDLVFLEKSRKFLTEHVRNHPDRPFFLYHATQAIHLPAIPAPEFAGTTKAGPLGDFIAEFDAIVGRLCDTLDELGVADNTIVVVTSDNGPEIVAAKVFNDYGHRSNGPWRGFKRDNWEGGHRVPLIVRWPGKIAPGGTCDETVCTTDLMATFAAISGYDLPATAAEDSLDISPLLLGEPHPSPFREFTVHETMSLALSVRSGKWKYLDHKGSGGNNYRAPLLAPFFIEDTAPDTPGQLYDLEADPGERVNLVEKHADTAARLKQFLDRFRAGERST